MIKAKLFFYDFLNSHKEIVELLFHHNFMLLLASQKN